MLLVSETAAYNFFPPSLDGTIYAPPTSRRYYVYRTVMILEGGGGRREKRRWNARIDKTRRVQRENLNLYRLSEHTTACLDNIYMPRDNVGGEIGKFSDEYADLFMNTPSAPTDLTRNRIIFIYFRKLFVIQAIASLASSFGKENKVCKVLFLRKCIVYRNKLCLVFCYTFYCNEIYTYDDIIKAYVENESLLIITSRSTETQNDTRAFERRNQLTINLRNQQSRDDDA